VRGVIITVLAPLRGENTPIEKLALYHLGLAQDFAREKTPDILSKKDFSFLFVLFLFV